MRYPASEKLEIIRTVEASHLPSGQTLKMLGIPNCTFSNWCARWCDGGSDALADRSPRPQSAWSRIPDVVRENVVNFALEHEDLTPRELAVKYNDEKRFASESSVYRILSANLDDYSVIIIAWKLRTAMKTIDVADTLELALDASGCNCATVVQIPRLHSDNDNGSSYVAADLADYLEDKEMDHVQGAPHHPQTQGKIPLVTLLHNALPGSGTLASNHYEPGSLGKLLATR